MNSVSRPVWGEHSCSPLLEAPLFEFCTSKPGEQECSPHTIFSS